MFDVLQISWWLIEATLVGYFINLKVFNESSDRVLFSPVSGFACVLVVGNMLWMWSVSIYLTSFIFVATLVLSGVFIARERVKPDLDVTLWLAGGALLVIFHGSLIPFSEKVFQGFPMDRYFYLGASILFEKENLGYFEDALSRIVLNGDKRSWFLYPLMPHALTLIKSRPAASIAFDLFAWATPRDLYRLANAWEVFMRVLQFSSVLALFWKGLGPRFLSGFLALAAVLGYWFQYTKDFNAWSSSACLALVIALIALVLTILNNGTVNPRSRYFAYLLVLAAVITYPELGIPSCLGIVILAGTNKVLRSGFIFNKRVYLELAGLVGAVFAVYPSIVAWLQRQSSLAPYMIGGEEAMARGIYRLLTTASERVEFVKNVVEEPLLLLVDPVSLFDMIIGSSGLPYVSYVRAPGTLFISLLIVGVLIWNYVASTRPTLMMKPYRKLWISLVLVVLYSFLFVVLRRNFIENKFSFAQLASLLLGTLIVGMVVLSAIKTSRPNLRVLLVLVGFYVVLFVSLLLLGMVGGSYRSLPFWGAFASISLLILLAGSKYKVLRALAVVVACSHVVFGFSIFYVTNTKGMEKYPSYYPNATGVRHFEIDTVRDKYDYDYTDIIPDLKLCHTVFIDLPRLVSKELRAPRFHAVNLMMFLENNDIRYYMSMPYRNSSPLIGDEMRAGFKKEEVNADCVVEDEIRDGRIGYKLIQSKWYGKGD